ALSWFGLDPDPAAVVLDDPLAQCQSDARAGIFAARMQALEDQKDALEVLRIDADSVVLDPKQPRIVPRFGSHMYLRRAIRAAKLDGVTHQVLEKDCELSGNGPDCWQRVVTDPCSGFLDRTAQILERLIEHPLAIGRLLWIFKSSNTGIAEQVVNERL